MPITDPKYGVEIRTAGAGTDCDTSSGSGDANYSVTTNGKTIQIGTVPIRSLGLENKHMYDAWGNRIMYAVAESAAKGADSADIKILHSYSEDPSLTRKIHQWNIFLIYRIFLSGNRIILGFIFKFRL